MTRDQIEEMQGVPGTQLSLVPPMPMADEPLDVVDELPKRGQPWITDFRTGKLPAATRIIPPLEPEPPIKPPAPPSLASTSPAMAGGLEIGAAAGVAIGAAIGGIETIAEAAKSPAGSISAFLPGGGGGGAGQDIMGQATKYAILTALRARAGIPSRFGG